MTALDLDRTILSGYDTEPRVNWAVIRALLSRGVRDVAIATNQGGLPWHVMGVTRRDGRPYPSPDQFLFRLAVAVGTLDRYGIAVAAVRACVLCRVSHERTAAGGAGEATGRHVTFRFDVRGHFRRLPDGRTVWVRPHQRGVEHELYRPKTYRVE